MKRLIQCQVQAQITADKGTGLVRVLKRWILNALGFALISRKPYIVSGGLLLLGTL